MSVLLERFQDPPKDFSPVPIWWWSGEPLDPQRLRWQLERFVEGGVYNLIILNLAPTGPLYGSDADDPVFFSEAWWSIFKGVCEDAKELGVYLWFYDQIGFSGANLQGEIVKQHPEFAGQSLERIAQEMSEPGILECPAGGQPIAAAAIPINGDGAPDGEPVALDVQDGKVAWTGSDRHRVMLFYAVERGFDYFNPAACRSLLDTVHTTFETQVGEFFGTTIVGSFQDELPSMPTWSGDFTERFRALHGYDLVPQLAALWEDYGDQVQRVRGDYHAARASLSETAFFKPLFDWHEQRGLICGFDQQGPARAGYPIACVDLYADYQRTHRWFQAPGSDHHGEAKIHSSLAHLYNRPRVWIEAFHSSGWGGTLEETFDWLLQWLRAGANLYDPHAVYYSTRGGWWEWAPPATDWRQPYWKHYSYFSRTVSRLCSVLTLGQHVCDVGVLFPNATVQAGLTPDGPNAEAKAAHAIYLQLVGKMLWYDLEPGVLDRACRDYDVLDDDSLARAQVRQGHLDIGEESYSTIILPGCTVLEAKTVRKLVEFVEVGGTLIAVGEPPRLTAGMGAAQEHVEALATLFEQKRAHRVATAEELTGLLAAIPAPIEAPVPTLIRRFEGSTLVFVQATFPRATEMPSAKDPRRGWFDVDYNFDPARYSRSMAVKVRGVKGAPMLWEPFSGSMRRLEVSKDDGDSVEVQVPFVDTPGVLLVWNPPAAGNSTLSIEGDATSAARQDGANLGEEVLADPWTVEVEPTLDNRWGDFALPASAKPLPVERWDLLHTVEGPDQDGRREGWVRPDWDDTNWAKIHVTFGPHGLWTGPDRPERLPSPLQTPNTAQDSPITLEQEGWDWNEAIYSLSRGLYKDRIHRATLGPKGHVPEEFLDFGRVQAGAAVQFRCAVSSDAPLAAHFALGAAARKTVWIDGNQVSGQTGGYLAIMPVTLSEGVNLIEFRLEAEEDIDLRAHFAFVQDPDRYRRPEWLGTGDEPRKDSLISFRKQITVPFAPSKAVMQVGADAPCRVYVNGKEAGRQGGFDPYFGRGAARIQPYAIAPYIQQGTNEIRIELSDLGASGSVLVDGLFEAEQESYQLISDETWEVTRDGKPVALRLRRRQWGDPGWAHLKRRPHPLPAARWLEGMRDADQTVIALVPQARPRQRRVEWARFLVPPGATRMHLSIHGSATVYLDGVETTCSAYKAQDGHEIVAVDLPQSESPRRLCAIRLETVPGHAAGGMFDGPIWFDMAAGAMTLGNWEDQGLSGYSGGIRYTKEVVRTQATTDGARTLLDLGRVRGTAEVTVNGTAVGTRIWSPYTFDVTDQLQAGENKIQVTVYNTLGPYLDAVSPTHFVFSGQTVSGILGPAKLVTVGARDTTSG